MQLAEASRHGQSIGAGIAAAQLRKGAAERGEVVLRFEPDAAPVVCDGEHAKIGERPEHLPASAVDNSVRPGIKCCTERVLVIASTHDPEAYVVDALRPLWHRLEPRKPLVDHVNTGLVVFALLFAGVRRGQALDIHPVTQRGELSVAVHERHTMVL